VISRSRQKKVISDQSQWAERKKHPDNQVQRTEIFVAKGNLL